MKHLALIVLPPLFLGLSLSLLAAPAQAEDILSILSRKAETPARLAPETIEYSYTLTLDVKERDGKDLNQGQAVMRIDPTQPAGSRAQIISTSDANSEALQNFLKEVEDPDNTMTKQANGFWCAPSDADSQSDFDLGNFTVVSQNETEAILVPNSGKLAKLLMMESDGNADKSDRKMMKKLMERIEGEMVLSKPSGELKGFSVRMTRPLTMMLVAKLKVMTVEQSCELAPNGHYRIGTMKMNIEGKAMGSRFGQHLNMHISDLTPIP